MRRTFTALSISAFALAGCSTGPAGQTEIRTEAETALAVDKKPIKSGAFPVTIKHALGETKIEKEPLKVATLGWSDHDFVLALGKVPVGAIKITWGGNEAGSTPWFDKKLQEQGGGNVTRYDTSDGVPFEEIAKLQPDLILGTNSGIKSEDYEKLTKIAPTVAYPKAPWVTPWEDSLTMIGQALGKPEAAAEIAQSVNQQFTDTAAKYPDLAGKKFAWAYFTPTDQSKFGLYTTEDARPRMLTKLGMKNSEYVVNNAAPGEFFTMVSAEKAGEVDADVLIFAATKEHPPALVKQHPLIGQMPALKANQYFGSTDNSLILTMSAPSPLSIPVALENFIPKIQSGLAGKPAE